MDFQTLIETALQKLWSAWGINTITPFSIQLFLLVTFSGFIVEALVVGWQESSLRKLITPSSSAWIDWIMTLCNLFQVTRLLGIIMTFGICYYLTGLIQKNIQFGLLQNVDSIAVQSIILLLAGDFKNYVRHLVFHRAKPLWMLHTMHHSAEEMTMLTAQRGHFVESAISAFFDVVIFVILGPSFVGFIFVQAVKDFHQLIIHSNIRSGWGWVGDYVLVSPAAHRLHHSTEEKHFNKNLGSVFIFWDRMFGTYHASEEIKTIGINIPGMHHTGFFTQLWISYQNFWMKLFNKT